MSKERFYELFASLIFGLCIKNTINITCAEEKFTKLFALLYLNRMEANFCGVALQTWIIRKTLQDCGDKFIPVKITHKLE